MRNSTSQVADQHEAAAKGISVDALRQRKAGVRDGDSDTKQFLADRATAVTIRHHAAVSGGL